MFAKTLLELEQDLSHELQLLNYPPANWLIDDPEIDCAVAVVGAGMAGLTAAFELIKMGVSNLMLFDSQLEGHEGPWNTYARMRTLRSGKSIPGPALRTSLLTFQAWYTAQFGFQAWETLYKVPTWQWMEYLKWFKKVLDLPVNNGCTLLSLNTDKEHISLKLDCQGEIKEVKTKKVILATGREGFGGAVIPAYVKELPKDVYAHTTEQIDFSKLTGKRVCVIGVGASGFDAAAVALENRAAFVEIYTRRSSIPNINKTASLSYPGCSEGYYALSDEMRWKIYETIHKNGSPPPFESLDRIRPYPNVAVRTGIETHKMRFENGEIGVETNQGVHSFDFLILATGFAVDGSQQPELRPFFDKIKLWKDCDYAQTQDRASVLAQFPYLGAHYQFLEKKAGEAPFLKNIHCFNYAATLTHWQLSGDIPDIDYGAERLARGIAVDLFTQDGPKYLEALKRFHKHEFLPNEYPFIL